MAAPHGNSISTTDLVRNLSTVIDRVRLERRNIAITKGVQTVAELVPPPQPGCSLPALQELLAQLSGMGKVDKNFSADLRRVRRSAKLPESSWGS